MRPLGFGVSFLPDATPELKPASEYFRDALSLARQADDAGLDFVKMTEHYLHPYGGYCPSPVAFLSAVAAVTKRIRLMTGGILPAFHHPVQVAAEAAMLDAISDGRAEIGFARAYLPHEFAALGIPLDESRERFLASIETIVRLWTETEVTTDTRFFSFEHARSLPRCTQVPHPPIWVAAVRSRESFAWIGQQGFKLLVTPGLGGYEALRQLVEIYRETFESGEEASEPEVAISLPLYIAETHEAAAVEADLYLRRYLDVWASAAKSWDFLRSSAYPGYGGMARAIEAQTPEAMRAHLAAVVGEPGAVVEEVCRLREELRIDDILWQIDFGAMPLDQARRTLTLFAEAVLPRLNEAQV